MWGGGGEGVQGGGQGVKERIGGYFVQYAFSRC